MDKNIYRHILNETSAVFDDRDEEYKRHFLMLLNENYKDSTDNQKLIKYFKKYKVGGSFSVDPKCKNKIDA